MVTRTWESGRPSSDLPTSCVAAAAEPCQPTRHPPPQGGLLHPLSWGTFSGPCSLTPPHRAVRASARLPRGLALEVFVRVCFLPVAPSRAPACPPASRPLPTALWSGAGWEWCRVGVVQGGCGAGGCGAGWVWGAVVRCRWACLPGAQVLPRSSPHGPACGRSSPDGPQDSRVDSQGPDVLPCASLPGRAVLCPPHKDSPTLVRHIHQRDHSLDAHWAPLTCFC